MGEDMYPEEDSGGFDDSCNIIKVLPNNTPNAPNAHYIQNHKVHKNSKSCIYHIVQRLFNWRN